MNSEAHNKPQRSSNPFENKKILEKTKYETRKARSMEMLKSGVEPIKDGFNEYYIPSQFDKNRRYKITINHGWYNCECPDNKESKFFKHTLFF